MNIENATKLVNHLKAVRDGTNGPVGFDMDAWFRTHGDWKGKAVGELTKYELFSCTTTACIAGHAQIIAGRGFFNKRKPAHHFAMDWLDLNSDALLFKEDWHRLGYEHNPDRPDLDQAIELLELLIARETGATERSPA